MDDAVLVQVLNGLENRVDDAGGVLLEKVPILDDAVKQLASLCPTPELALIL